MMFADFTGFGTDILWILGLCALSFVLMSWPKWQQQLHAWQQQRKENDQKIEMLLTEIRDLLRQKS